MAQEPQGGPLTWGSVAKGVIDAKEAGDTAALADAYDFYGKFATHPNVQVGQNALVWMGEIQREVLRGDGTLDRTRAQIADLEGRRKDLMGKVAPEAGRMRQTPQQRSPELAGVEQELTGLHSQMDTLMRGTKGLTRDSFFGGEVPVTDITTERGFLEGLPLVGGGPKDRYYLEPSYARQVVDVGDVAPGGVSDYRRQVLTSPMSDGGRYIETERGRVPIPDFTEDKAFMGRLRQALIGMDPGTSGFVNRESIITNLGLRANRWLGDGEGVAFDVPTADPYIVFPFNPEPVAGDVSASARALMDPATMRGIREAMNELERRGEIGPTVMEQVGMMTTGVAEQIALTRGVFGAGGAAMGAMSGARAAAIHPALARLASTTKSAWGVKTAGQTTLLPRWRKLQFGPENIVEEGLYGIAQAAASGDDSALGGGWRGAKEGILENAINFGLARPFRKGMSWAYRKTNLPGAGWLREAREAHKHYGEVDYARGRVLEMSPTSRKLRDEVQRILGQGIAAEQLQRSLDSIAVGVTFGAGAWAMRQPEWQDGSVMDRAMLIAQGMRSNEAVGNALVYATFSGLYAGAQRRNIGSYDKLSPQQQQQIDTLTEAVVRDMTAPEDLASYAKAAQFVEEYSKEFPEDWAAIQKTTGLAGVALPEPGGPSYGAYASAPGEILAQPKTGPTGQARAAEVRDRFDPAQLHYNTRTKSLELVPADPDAEPGFYRQNGAYMSARLLETPEGPAWAVVFDSNHPRTNDDPGLFGLRVPGSPLYQNAQDAMAYANRRAIISERQPDYTSPRQDEPPEGPEGGAPPVQPTGPPAPAGPAGAPVSDAPAEGPPGRPPDLPGRLPLEGGLASVERPSSVRGPSVEDPQATIDAHATDPEHLGKSGPEILESVREESVDEAKEHRRKRRPPPPAGAPGHDKGRKALQRQRARARASKGRTNVKIASYETGEHGLRKFIQAKGGLNATAGQLEGELRRLAEDPAIAKRDIGVPNLVRKGMTVDAALKTAAEAGFFPGQDPAALTPDDLVQALDSNRQLPETTGRTVFEDITAGAQREGEAELGRMAEAKATLLGQAETSARAAFNAMRESGMIPADAKPRDPQVQKAMWDIVRGDTATREAFGAAAQDAGIEDPVATWEKLHGWASDYHAYLQELGRVFAHGDPEMAGAWEAFLDAGHEMAQSGSISPDTRARLGAVKLLDDTGQVLGSNVPETMAYWLSAELDILQRGMRSPDAPAETALPGEPDLGTVDMWAFSPYAVVTMFGRTPQVGQESKWSRTVFGLGRLMDKAWPRLVGPHGSKKLRRAIVKINRTLGQHWGAAPVPRRIAVLQRRAVEDIFEERQLEGANAMFHLEERLNAVNFDGRKLSRKQAKNFAAAHDSGVFKRAKNADDFARIYGEDHRHLWGPGVDVMEAFQDFGQGLHGLGLLTDAQLEKWQGQYVMHASIRAQEDDFWKRLKTGDMTALLPNRDMSRDSRGINDIELAIYNPYVLFMQSGAQESQARMLFGTLTDLRDRGVAISPKQFGDGRWGLRGMEEFFETAAHEDFRGRKSIDPFTGYKVHGSGRQQRLYRGMRTTFEAMQSRENAGYERFDTDESLEAAIDDLRQADKAGIEQRLFPFGEPPKAKEQKKTRTRVLREMAQARDTLKRIDEPQYVLVRSPAPMKAGEHPFTPTKERLLEFYLGPDFGQPGGRAGAVIPSTSAVELSQMFDRVMAPKELAAKSYGRIARVYDGMWRYWRANKTIRHLPHWFWQTTSTVLMNHAHGTATMGDFVESVLFGRGVFTQGLYAEGFRRSLAWEAWVKLGKPDRESLPPEWDDQRYLDAVGFNETAERVGSGTFYRQMIESGTISDVMSKATEPDEITAEMLEDLKRSGITGDSAEMMEAAIADWGRRSGYGVGQIRKKVLAKIGTPNPAAATDALMDWNEQYQLYEVFFRDVGSMAVHRANPGMDWKRAVRRGMEGAGAYVRNNPNVRAFSRNMTFMNNPAFAETARNPALKNAAQVILGFPFINYAASIAPTAMQRMSENPTKVLGVLAALGVTAMHFWGDMSDEDKADWLASGAGLRGSETESVFTKEDVKRLKERIDATAVGIGLQVPEGGREEIAKLLMGWYTLNPHLVPLTGDKKVDLDRAFPPLEAALGLAKFARGGNLSPAAILDWAEGVQMQTSMAVAMGVVDVFNPSRKGRTRAETVIYQAKKLAGEMFSQMDPEFAMGSSWGQKMGELALWDGQRAEDRYRGLRPEMTPGVEDITAMALATTFVASRATSTYDKLFSADENLAGEFLSQVIPEVNLAGAGAQERTMIATRLLDQVLNSMGATYRDKQEGNFQAPELFVRMVEQRLAIGLDVAQGADGGLRLKTPEEIEQEFKAGHRPLEGYTDLGHIVRGIKKQGSHLEDPAIRAAIAWRESAANSRALGLALGVAEQGQVHPRLLRRMFRGALRDPNGKGLQAMLYREVIVERRRGRLDALWPLFANLPVPQSGMERAHWEQLMGPKGFDMLDRPIEAVPLPKDVRSLYGGRATGQGPTLLEELLIKE